MNGSGRRDLLASLLPIAKALRRIEDDAAGVSGLTMWQYAVLSVVDDQRGLNQGQVADALGYSRNRIVDDVDRLESQGLVERRRGDDRRANVLHITTRGRKVKRSVRTAIHTGEDVLLDGLPQRVRSDLGRVAVAVARHIRTT